MGAFQQLNTEGVTKQADTLGGGFEAVPTDIYEATIKLAYAGKANSSNAQSLTLHLDLDGKEMRETVWVTTKDGNPFYVDKQDSSKKIELPGFTVANDICLLTVGLPLAEVESEEKMVKLYNYQEKKELPTATQVLTPLIGQKVTLGILAQTVDKQAKGDDGKYHNTGETRTENTIDRVFSAENHRTVNEHMHEVMTPDFYDAWKTRNSGKPPRMKAKGLSGGSGPGQAGSGRPGAAGGTQTATKKLFGKS